MSTLKRGFLLTGLATLLVFAVCAYSNATVTVRLSDSAGSDSFEIRNSGTISVFNVFSNGRIGIGTTTPSAMLHIIGSSTVSSTTLNIVGTVTVTGTLTATNLDVSLGTVTAAGFIGDGSRLTNLPSGGFVVTTSNFATDVDFVTVTGTMSVGSSFLVDNSGSMTASNITSTGSITSTFLRIEGNTFVVDSTGSMTAAGTATVGGLKVGSISFPNTDGTSGQVLESDGSGNIVWTTDDAGSSVFTSSNGSATTTLRVGIGTVTPSSDTSIGLTLEGTATVNGNVDVSRGTVTASGFVGDGSLLTNLPSGDSVVVTTTNFATDVDFVTITGTMSVGSSFLVDNSGSMTASNIISTGSITSTSLRIEGNTFVVDSTGSMTVAGTATVGGLKVGSISFPNTDGISGQVITTNGAGVASWATSGGDSDAWTSVDNGSASTTSRIGIGTTTPSLDTSVGLTVEGTSTVRGNIIIGTGTAFYFGDPASNNTWRVIISGADLSFERLESGAWVSKVKMNP